MLRVCMAQINTTVGDLEGNTRRICEAIDRSRDLGTDIICFPELSISGYPPEDLLLKADFVRGNLASLEEVARCTKGIAAVVGFVDQGTHLYNAAAMCVDGERVGIYNNLVGGQDELVFDGMSMIFDHTGAWLARGKQFEEDFVYCDVDPEAVRRHRLFAPVRAAEDDEGPIETYTLHVSAARSRQRPSIPPAIAEPLDPHEEIYRALALGTRDYVRKNGFANVVVGLAGGIDSALVAAIATDALGPQHGHTAWMPSRYSSQESRRFAREVAANLGSGLIDLEIDRAFEAFLQTLQPLFAGRPADAAEENVQARIRGTLLMALSNKFGRLVLTTGNKSEMSVGYATLYGDMAGGFAVIKDVPKTLVYDLARWRNGRRSVIPEGVLTRAPTAEVRAGPKDNDTLPPYEILDPILKLYVEEDTPPADIVAAGYPAEVVRRVIAMVDRNEYKRRQAPPGVKITPKAFGKDRRLPITNWYRSALTESTESRLDGQ